MEAQRGQKVHTSYSIKVDIDSKTIDWKRIKLVLSRLREMKLKMAKGEVFKTNHGWHVYIWVDSIADIYLPFIQLLFGSDYKREILNFERVYNLEEDWNVLFQDNEKLSSNRSKKLNSMLKI